MQTHSKDLKRAARIAAARIAGIYAIVGALWIAFSDRLAGLLASDPATLTWLQTVKGWFFIAATATLLYFLVERVLVRLQHTREKRRASESARRAAEDALAEKERVLTTLHANLPGMAYRCRNDPRWTMEVVSEGVEDLTGYTASDLIGNSKVAFADLIHPDDREAVWSAVQRAIETDRTFQLSYRIRTAQGEEKWVWEQGCGVLDEDGSVIGLEGFITDVTDKKQLKSQFLQAQKMETIGQLVGAVAHDFNNVLTAILGLSQMLLADEDLNESTRDDIQEIHQAGRRASQLTHQLLSFSRQQSGVPSVVSLNDVVTDLETMLRRLAGSDIEFTVSLDADAGHVSADPGQLQQVLMNLAVNARDAMPDGGVLTIQTAGVELDEAYAAGHPGAATGAYAMLAVSDTGTGMHAETQARVFDPFFTTKEPGEGTGLGLSTVRNIVQDNGGHLWVYSAPGQGSTFKVYLPRVDEMGTPLSVDVAEPEALPGGNERILLVDDEHSLRIVLREALERMGYDVAVAESAESALELLRDVRDPLELLITDLMLPQMTGRELADRVTADRAAARVLFLSGFAETQVERSQLLKSDEPFLQKPFSARAFLQKVRETLDARD